MIPHPLKYDTTKKWLVICSIHSPCCFSFLQWSCDCNKHLLPLLLALDYNNCTATCYCVLCIDNDNKTTSVETSCINILQIRQDQPSPASTASSCIVFSNSNINVFSKVKIYGNLSDSTFSLSKVPASVFRLVNAPVVGRETKFYFFSMKLLIGDFKWSTRWRHLLRLMWK